MNKNLIALMAAVASTSVFASATITGTYEGVLAESTSGAATYTQDLDLTMKASVAPGTSVTMTMENLTGGSTVSATTAFIETQIEGINFKGG